MILALDIGNTNIVIGCMEKDRAYFVERVSTNSSKTELEYVVDFKRCWICIRLRWRTSQDVLSLR